MKLLGIFFLLCVSLKSFAETSEVPPSVAVCNSFETYKSTVKYLKEQKDLPFSEPQILKAALEINKGCDGAEIRFQRVFELLVKSGVTIRQSYDLAVDFAKMTNQKTDNFVVLFKGLFLENKFDLDFMTAYKTALQLSAALPKDWEKVRTDFRAFLDFCASEKSDDLPIHLCAKWTLDLMRHEDLFALGIYPSFSKLNDYLSSKKGLQLPIRNRLHLITQLISYGPKAPENFQQSLDWLASKKGAGLSTAKAHTLALEIAKNSLRSDAPAETEKSLTP